MTETTEPSSLEGQDGTGKTSQEIVAEYEEMFKDRYTETDEPFMETFNSPYPDPPCVSNWYSRPKRNYDWSRDRDRGRGRGRGRGGDRHYGGDRHHGGGYNRDRGYNNRDRGYDNHRGGYHQGRGYNRDNRDRQQHYGQKRDDGYGNYGNRDRVNYAGQKRQHESNDQYQRRDRYQPY